VTEVIDRNAQIKRAPTKEERDRNYALYQDPYTLAAAQPEREPEGGPRNRFRSTVEKEYYDLRK